MHLLAENYLVLQLVCMSMCYSATYRWLGRIILLEFCVWVEGTDFICKILEIYGNKIKQTLHNLSL